MSLLTVHGLEKRFGKGQVLVGVGFTLNPGEILALLGPSGSGKTTLLRILAGLETPDAGWVRLGKRTLVGPGVFLPPEARGIGFVFQEPALFPHLRVVENVAFGLKGRDRRQRAEQALAALGLTAFRNRRPHELSGGQAQRVALARALAPKPHVLLLDEPFASLDAGLREGIRSEVRAAIRAQRIATLLVTHDQEEALAFADRLAVLHRGRLVQIGTPEEVYHRPRTPFVANFLGHTNLLKGEAHGDHAETALGRIAIVPMARGPVWLSLRPEHLALADEGIPGKVVDRAFKGHDVTLWVRTAAGVLRVQADYRTRAKPGDAVRLVPREPAVVLEGEA